MLENKIRCQISTQSHSCYLRACVNGKNVHRMGIFLHEVGRELFSDRISGMGTMSFNAILTFNVLQDLSALARDSQSRLVISNMLHSKFIPHDLTLYTKCSSSRFVSLSSKILKSKWSIPDLSSSFASVSSDACSSSSVCGSLTGGRS